MMEQLLHTVCQWESARPAFAVYEHIFYSGVEPGKVLAVHGFVKVVKRIPVPDGHSRRKLCYQKAVWNAEGHCRVGRYNVREQAFDIPFSE